MESEEIKVSKREDKNKNKDNPKHSQKQED